jgi:hypothetical protein
VKLPRRVTLNVLAHSLQSRAFSKASLDGRQLVGNKIKVSGRLSAKTVLAGGYLKLVSARVGSCFSWSCRLACGDGT